MQMQTREKVLSFGGFHLVPSRHQLLDGDRPLRVGSRALGLLELLVGNAGQVVTKDQLIDAVWSGVHVDEANLRANILALRRVLRDGRDGRRYIQNVPGRGYRFVEPVISKDISVATISNGQNKSQQFSGLDSNSLIGRAAAIENVASQLATYRLVSIVGSGGIGKTSVASVVADHWHGSHRENAVFIDVTTTGDADQLWTAAAAVLGLDVTPSARAQVLRSMRSRKCLIVLDSCEHVVQAAAGFCEEILKEGVGVRILATSREPLRIQGEWVHRLAPLEYPEIGATITADEALSYPAIELLVERIAATVGGFALTDKEAPFAAEICQKLGGVPLALELAAAQSEAFNMKQLAEGLRDRFNFLSRGRRTALPRHQSLRAMLEWSCQLLTEAERTVLRRLSVFPAWFDMSDATALGARVGMSSGLVSGSVANLVSKSILTANLVDEGARYRLPETVHAFAREQLVYAGEVDETFRALADYVTQQCTSDSDAADDAKLKWLARCTRNLDSVRVCLDWAIVDGKDPVIGTALITKVLPFWMLASRLIEHRQYLEPALAHVIGLRPRRKSDELALEVAITLSQYYSGGPTNEIIIRLKRALVLARKIASKRQELDILWMLYGISGNAGNYRVEMDFAQQFNEACSGASERETKIRRHRLLARAYHDIGEQRNALREIDRALTPPLLRAPAQLDAYSIEDVTAALAIRARILWIMGRAEDAMSAAEECLARGLAVDHAQSISWSIAFNLCPLAIWSGDFETANRFASLAITQSEKTFEHWNEWAHLYRTALRRTEGDSLPSHLLSRMIPAQKDIFATLWPEFAGDDISARAVRQTSWCSAEFMRLAAARADNEVALRLLQQADLLAKQQDALAWRLRIAIDLAKRHLVRDQTSKARSALAPVYDSFKQGFNSKDLRTAAQILSSI
jgi:predicted ATPase/DNA-binding winged helix-turn-helix (wHTH) protein